MTVAVEARALGKNFGARRVLDDVSFNIEAGEVVALMGRNGSGKSSLIRLMLGLYQGQGCTLYAGRRLVDLPNPSAHVGIVLDTTGFDPRTTVDRHLRWLSRARRTDDSRVDRVVRDFGLSPELDNRCGSLSLGMRQRLKIASAMLPEPPVLILDEPTNGLDPFAVDDVNRLLRSHADAGGAVLVATHSLQEVAEIADRTLVAANGQVSEVVSPVRRRGPSAGVLVDSPHSDFFRHYASDRGLQVDVLSDSRTVLFGATNQEIALAAQTSQVIILEMRPWDRVEETAARLREWGNARDR